MNPENFGNILLATQVWSAKVFQDLHLAKFAKIFLLARLAKSASNHKIFSRILQKSRENIGYHGESHFSLKC
jgi:hypothetical protein